MLANAMKAFSLLVEECSWNVPGIVVKFTRERGTIEPRT